MTYFFETYGCQMNQAESSSVEQQLLARGWTAAPSVELADLIVVNTCSVRITAETRALSRLSLFSSWKRKRDVRVIVMGCMAERMKAELRLKYKKLDYVVGMFERDRFAKIIDEIALSVRAGSDGRAAAGDHAAAVVLRPADGVPSADDESPVDSYYFASSSWQSGAFQSYVPIMNGCDNFCAYCIVPYVRGRETSRPMNDILDELDSLADKGVREITLLGQNVNSYRWTDPGTGRVIGFPELLTNVARRIERKNRIRWVRFMSSHPKDLSDELIDVIERERVLCRFIHLPVQSGSNRVLEAMNRKYTRESYLALAGRMRERIPDATFSTDILVGFPGETEEDVDDTLDLIRRVKFEVAFMFHYNPREGTKAYAMDGRIPDDVKKERLARVIKLQHAVSAALMRKRVGQTVLVLVESTSRNDPDELFGHTELGEMVVFDAKLDPSLVGHFVSAELTCLKGRTFRARRIGDDAD